MDAARSGTKPFRLGAFVDGVGWVEHEYGRVWQREENGLAVAPDFGQIDLILRLAERMSEPFRVGYVLLVPRDDGLEEGTFSLDRPLSRDDLERFLRRYQELFEGDGRHHLVIRSADSEILFDQHNVLYLKGPLDEFETELDRAGIRRGEIRLPSPHSHHYHEELDALLDDMLDRYSWVSG